MVDTLRVTTWDDFIGQEKLKRRLGVHIEAAKTENRAMEHVLLTGPPGFGKTSLASIIAERLNKPLDEFTMPISERTFIAKVRACSGVILLDEIHRGSIKEQESLLPVLEFGWIAGKNGVRYAFNDITIIGATTEPDKVIPPLYDRFAIRPDFEEYTPAELGQIVSSMALKAGVTMDDKTAQELGRATGGTPRRARQYVLAAHDLAITEKQTPTGKEILGLCRVDEDGLTAQHLDYLQALEKLGGTSGLKTLQNVLRLNEIVVRELERLLIKNDLMMYTDRGREILPDGYEKVKNRTAQV